MRIVYGIAADGTNFLFHHLNEKPQLQTKFVEGSDRLIICKYIDIILESAIRATPHTSPVQKFPRSVAQFYESIEVPLGNRRVETARSIIVQTEKEMESVIRPDASGPAQLVYVGPTDADVTEKDQEEEGEAEVEGGAYEDDVVGAKP